MFKLCSTIIAVMILAMVIMIVLPHSAMGQNGWTSLQGPPKARDVRDIAISNNGTTLYACDKTVLFKSTNSATSWVATVKELSSPLVVTCKPDNPNNVVAGVIGTIYLNTNGGESGTWEPVLPNAGTPLRLAVSPISTQYNQMYLGRQRVSGFSSIYYSDNSGASWSPRFPSSIQTDIYDIAPHPVSGTGRNNDVWAVGSNGTTEGTNQQNSAVTRGVWWSADLGQTWSEKKMGDFNVRTIGLRDMGLGNWPRVVVGTLSGKVSRSTDGGSTWSTPTTLASGVTSITVIRFRSDVNQFFATTNNGVYLSADDGSSWTAVDPTNIPDKNILSFAIVPSSQSTIYAGASTTLYRKTGTGNWTPVDNGLGRMP